jgi:hypothetical protein
MPKLIYQAQVLPCSLELIKEDEREIHYNGKPKVKSTASSTTYGAYKHQDLKCKSDPGKRNFHQYKFKIKKHHLISRTRMTLSFVADAWIIQTYVHYSDIFRTWR